MPTRPRMQRTDLHDDHVAARSLAVAAGAHGVYVQNALDAGEGEGFVVHVDDTPRAVAWCGPRGNLVVIADDTIASQVVLPVVDGLQRLAFSWRIVMGPAGVVAALRDQLAQPPLVDRDQVYYVGDRHSEALPLQPVVVRAAAAVDRDRLVQATLLLNLSDLNIQPVRVDRRWLRETVEERMRSGATWVAGPPGAMQCKLDIGSEGPAGQVIEGVFTFAEHRGRGCAAALVASRLRAAPGNVTLHVGLHNQPARRAYERAGMRIAGGCRLMLLG